jgi:hypothetical protein
MKNAFGILVFSKGFIGYMNEKLIFQINPTLRDTHEE